MDNSTSWNRLVPSLADLAVQELQKAIQSAFVEADDALFKLAENGNNSNDHMDSVRILRQSKQQLLSQWAEKEKRNFLKWGKPKEKEEQSFELSLVEFEEMEETLAVQQMSSSFEKSHSHLFGMMEQVWQKAWMELNPHETPHLDHDHDLYNGSSQNDHSLNDNADEHKSTNKMNDAVHEAPLQPCGIALSISSWLAETPLPMASKVVLLKIMEREINAHLDGVLRKAVAHFTNAGWKIVSQQEALKATQRAIQQRRQQQGQAKAEDEGQSDFGALPSDQGNQWLDTVQGDAGMTLPPFDANATMPSLHETPTLPTLPQTPMGALQPFVAQDPNIWRNINIPRFEMGSAVQHFATNDGMSGNPEGNHPYSQAPIVSDRMADAFAQALYQLMGPGKWERRYEMEGNILNEEIGAENWDTNLSDFLSLLQKRRIRASQRPRPHSFLSSEVVHEILKELQHRPPAILQEALEDGDIDDLLDISFAKVLKKEISSRAVTDHLVPQDEATLNDIDEDATDIVGMVFEVFLRDRHIHESVRKMIVQLVPAYVRIAMDDRKMFMNKKHPARKFLDMVAQACEGNTGDSLGEKNVLARLEEGIENILDGFESNLDVFNEATDAIKEAFDKQQQVIQKTQQRSVESMRSQERLELAEKESKSVFVEQLKDVSWPQPTIDKLEQHWCQYYKILFLQSQNAQNDPEKSKKNMEDAVNLLSRLVQVGETGVAKSIEEPKMATKLHADMSVMFGASGLIDLAGQEATIEMLSLLDQAYRWNGLAQSGAMPNVVESMMETPQPEPPPEEPIKQVEETIWVNPDSITKHKRRITAKDFPTSQDLMDYFSNMALGTWVDFIKPDGKVIPAKLEFVSPISMRLVFVTAKGFKHAMESAQDLAIMVKLDKLRLREYAVGDEGFEQSFKKAIQQLNDDIPVLEA